MNYKLIIVIIISIIICTIDCLTQDEIDSFMNGDLIPPPRQYITNCTEHMDLAKLSHVHIVTSSDSLAGVGNVLCRTLRYRAPSNQSQEIPFGRICINTDNGYSLSSFTRFEIRSTEMRQGRLPSAHALNEHLLTPTFAFYIGTRDTSLPLLGHVRITITLYIDCIGSLESLEHDQLYTWIDNPHFTGSRLLSGHHTGMFIKRDTEREQSSLPPVGSSKLKAPVTHKHIRAAVSVGASLVAPNAQFSFRPTAPGVYSIGLVQLKGSEVAHNIHMDTNPQETYKMVTSTFIYNSGILCCTIIAMVVTIILYKLGQRDGDKITSLLKQVIEKQDKQNKKLKSMKVNNNKTRYNINDDQKNF